MNDRIVDTLRNMVVESLDVTLPDTGIAPDTPLFDGGLELDSFAIVELITQVEEHYDFEFREEDLRPESFADLATVAEVIARRVGG